jgi:hypothetical protein
MVALVVFGYLARQPGKFGCCLVLREGFGFFVGTSA